ncbi:unnamed protein product [Schistosoma bovis]|uniref:Pentatricopeptide repeat domain-containing protein 3 n=1 Tax=Schistosoma bovis TaxID=6184 RepID=A0A430Q9R8_SCHBO|nr:pentatricopeptide repeat domain-containing protein 3 [Schistosoma bovis]CAH8468217.1 unnamed protein product [Schistosoma bovis]CAH8469393.1 unnamed protein product [Schistosoma bovis]
MLRYSCVTHASSITRNFLFKTYFSKLSSLKLKEENNSPDVNPPLKRYRNSTSVIRALISCVQPVPEAPIFYLGPDFSYLSTSKTRLCMLSKAKGRLAARVSARDFFPNDITALSTEAPHIKRWIPIQTPDSILKRAVEGSLSNDEAMDRLILLLAPKHSWKLYNEIAPDYKWTSNTLHRLLDLLCVTNGGRGGSHSHVLLNNYNWSNLPDPDEIYMTHRFDFIPRYNHDKQIITNQNELENITDDEINYEFTGDSISLVGESNNWNLDSPAEKLFHKEFNILNTPAGYRSMIRGAARFGNADRAFELTKLVWESKNDDKYLDLATYNQLIRSLHQLTVVMRGEENLWNVILDILEHVKTCGDPINISIFTNILYTLAYASAKMKYSTSPTLHLSNGNYVSIGLGLLNELKRLNFKPELGTLANLLLLIHETPAPVNRSSTSTINKQNDNNNLINYHTDHLSYTCSNLLNELLNEVEIYFNNNNSGIGGSPQRFDAWTMDDYTFFPIAMKCAVNELNVELGQKIHNLLIHHEDRTFLLPNSRMKRTYMYHYCRLMIQFNECDMSEFDQLIQRYNKTYCQYFEVILSSNSLLIVLIKNYNRILRLCDSYTVPNLKIPLNKKTYNQQTIHSIKLAVYSHLCRILNDLLNTEFSHYLYVSPSTIKRITLTVCKWATINPKNALDMSMNLINTLKRLDNSIKPMNDVSTTTRSHDVSGIKVDQSIMKQYDQLVKFMIIESTKLCFPIFDELSTEYNNDNKINREEYLTWKTKLINALYDWFSYAESHKMITWEWAIKGLYILWKEDDFIQLDFMWNVMQCLAKQNVEFEVCVREKRDLLEPILNILEQSIPKIPQQDIRSIEKLECLQFLRKVLSATESTNILPLYSSTSNAVEICAHNSQ